MSQIQTPTGVLLINLGTPAGPGKKQVRAYLAEFLNDPRVIELATPWRQILVKGFILPFRPKKSAHAYQQIWTAQGSPLAVYSQQLVETVSQALGNSYAVELGMRYGKPSIPSALQKLLQKKCRKILVLPLFPQYSSAATGSALAKTLQELHSLSDIPAVTLLNSFFDHPAFIDAWKTVILEQTSHLQPDMWIFSYHSLPIRRGNYLGYRQQCLDTSRLLADSLKLQSNQYRVGFQSRLGRTPWIPPYTDHLLTELAGQGIKNIAIACPSFVTDCLETLEEIGIRARKQWQSLGGENFTLVSCLNTHPVWVKALCEIIQKL